MSSTSDKVYAAPAPAPARDGLPAASQVGDKVSAATVFVRSVFWVVQAMCALLELGPPTRGAVDKKKFDVVDASIDRWIAANATAKEGAVFPTLIPRVLEVGSSSGDWVSEPREMYAYDVKAGKYLSPNPVMALTSYDQPQVIKGMCVVACAHRHKHVRCGVPSSLSRYRALLPNREFSAKDGVIYANALGEVCYSSDTMALEVYEEEEKSPAVSPSSSDLDVWLPFVVLALRHGAEFNPGSVEAELRKTFDVAWSTHMLTACLNLLDASGYAAHMQKAKAAAVAAQPKVYHPHPSHYNNAAAGAGAAAAAARTSSPA